MKNIKKFVWLLKRSINTTKLHLFVAIFVGYFPLYCLLVFTEEERGPRLEMTNFQPDSPRRKKKDEQKEIRTK